MNHRNAKPNHTSLAELIDSLLTGEAPLEPGPTGANAEEQGLYHTVELLIKAIPDSRPAPEMQAHIRSRLVKEWHKSVSADTTRPGRWTSSRQIQRYFAVGITVTAIVIVLLGLWLAPAFGNGMPAAAQKPAFIPLVIFVGVLVILAGLFWWSQHKPK